MTGRGSSSSACDGPVKGMTEGADISPTIPPTASFAGNSVPVVSSRLRLLVGISAVVGLTPEANENAAVCMGQGTGPGAPPLQALGQLMDPRTLTLLQSMRRRMAQQASQLLLTLWQRAGPRALPLLALGHLKTDTRQGPGEVIGAGLTRALLQPH